MSKINRKESTRTSSNQLLIFIKNTRVHSQPGGNRWSRQLCGNDGQFSQ